MFLKMTINSKNILNLMKQFADYFFFSYFVKWKMPKTGNNG